MKQAVPFKVLILLCVGLLGVGEGRYCPRCAMKTSENDSCTFQVYADSSCDCSDSEYVHGILNSDSFQTIANSFQVAINYTSKLHANVIVSWVLPDEDHLSNTTFHLKITYHQFKKTVCLPLANTITKVTAQLLFLPKQCRAENVDQISVTLTANGERFGQIRKSLSIYDCFVTMGNKSDHICGPRIKVPHAPMSAEATVIDQPPGKTVVKVSWEPPMDGAVPVWYNLDLWCNPLDKCSLFLDVPGNSTETIVTINLTLSPSNGAYFKVRSGGYVDGPDCDCLHWPIPQLKQTVFFCNGTNAIFQFPDHPQPLNVHLIIWPVLAGVLVVVLVFLLVIYSARRLCRWIRKPDPSDDDLERFPDDDDVMDTHEQGTVFLVASTEEDERVRRRIRHLCHVLGEHGQKPVYYEYVVNDHSADSPSALGMNRWVELQFSRCEFVLFVCTKRFLEEWKGERSEMPSPLVYPCRNLLDGSIQHPRNNNRYAVLFMGDGHRVPSLLGCFRQFDIFQVGSEEIHADALIHFLLDAPSCVPRVVDFFRHLV